MGSVAKLLANQLQGLRQNPVEGFLAELTNDADLFNWTIWIEGPKDTPYEGGIFPTAMVFPKDYPMSPPTLRFTSDFWHPNVYQNGTVCISILHPPGEDAMSGELPEERWLPTQTVETILLSVISMLSDPNFSSPANVDASVEWRNNPEGFQKRVARLVERTKVNTPKHVQIPHPDTNPVERARQIEKFKELNSPADEMDFFDDDDYDGLEDDYDGDDFSDFQENDYEDEDEEEEDEEEEEVKVKPKVVEKPVQKQPEPQVSESQKEVDNDSSKNSSTDSSMEPASKKRKKDKKSKPKDSAAPTSSSHASSKSKSKKSKSEKKSKKTAKKL